MDKMHAASLRQVLLKIDAASTIKEKSSIALRYMLYSAPLLLEAIENHECQPKED